MNDASNSTDNPTEHCGDKEPKREVPDETDNQEPVRKRVRLSDGLGTSSGSSDSLFGVLEGMFEKNRELGEKVKNLHNGMLEISDSAVADNDRLDEKIRKIEEEHKEQVSKLKAEQNEWKKEILEMREIVLKLTNNSNGDMIHPAQNQEEVEKMKNDINKEKLKTRLLEHKLLEIETENLELKKKVIKLEDGIHQFQKNLENQDLELKDRAPKAQKLLQNFTKKTESEIHKKISNIEDESEKATQTTEDSADREIKWLRDRILTVEKDLKEEVEECGEKQEKAVIQLKKMMDGYVETLKQIQEDILQFSSNGDALSQLQDIVEVVQKDLKAVKSVEKGFKEWNSYFYGKVKKLERSQGPLSQSINQLKEIVSNLEKANEDKVKDSIDQQPVVHEISPMIRSIFPSDNCKLPPTQAEMEYRNKCIFCGANHKSIDCPIFPNFADRRSSLFRQKRCIKCLDLTDQKYAHVCQRATFMCSDCHWDVDSVEAKNYIHHMIVCPLNDQTPQREERRRKENERRLAHGQPIRFNGY